MSFVIAPSTGGGGGADNKTVHETTATTVSSTHDADEDLEDGEIDDDDDEDNENNLPLKPPPLDHHHPHPHPHPHLLPPIAVSEHSRDDDVQFMGTTTHKDDDIVFMGVLPAGGEKSKKPQPHEDDHASSIENAIANALKKKGIEPPMPKMLSSNADDPTASPNLDGSSSNAETGSQSRSSRRRKRKKEREREQKKEKEQNKRSRRDSLEDTGAVSDDMDMEYEMLNVRGGSPPPSGSLTVPGGGAPPLPRYPGDWPDLGDQGGYDSPDYSSYDSYSDEELSASQRRRQRRDKDAGGRGKKRRDNDRRHQGGTASGKRNRRDSVDEKSAREPRKLELCKFYLMDCCAKRDKCSYMHKEFPCKYYYLGMDCFAGDSCLFHHGEPLNEQLRNILLKHMETAPKEILGEFKRITRDNAMGQLTRRHEELCTQFGVENTWSSPLTLGISRNRQSGAEIQQQLQQQQQQQQQQQTLNQSGAQSGGGAIPSLLDMVINPPPNISLDPNKLDKKRKSRWAEKTSAAANSPNKPAGAVAANSSPASAAATSSAATATASVKALPSHLDLVNLRHVLSAEHMAKLNKLGISNLEEMMQVPFGQLTEAGLTLIEIGEIQKKAAAVANGDAPEGSITTSRSSAKSEATTTTTNATTTNTSSNSSKIQDLTQLTSSNSNSNSNGGFIMVDYTQYLKDAHVNFDRNDLIDDDRDDEEQLVIDDGNESEEESPAGKNKEDGEGSTKSDEEGQTKETGKGKDKDDEDSDAAAAEEEEDDVPKPSVFDLPTFMSKMLNSNKSSPPTNVSPTPSAPQAAAASSLVPGKPTEAESRAAFYRDIIRNPFRANSDDANSNDANSNSATGGLDSLIFGQHDSRSITPTPTGNSSTPEPGSQSPKPLEEALQTLGGLPKEPPHYARSSMYDYDPVTTKQQAARAAAARKTDQDLRSLTGLGLGVGLGFERDIDMRLPFEPIKHYLPATEIDAAIFSHSPIRWQLQEVDVEPAVYIELRLAAAYKDQKDIRDPRMRRILGLPELPDSLAAEESERKLSNSISSPESVHMSPSPRDSTPTSPPPSSLQLPSMSVPPPSLSVPPPIMESAAPAAPRTDPRRDPRRAHLALDTNTNSSSSGGSGSGTGSSYSGGAAAGAAAAGGARQILEIRNLLQTSNWYRNLGSNNKIAVHQQLELVFGELKKYHQQDQPAKKPFDSSFVVNNRSLQQIFGQLHFYINDSGQIVQLQDDGGSSSNNGNNGNAVGIGGGGGGGNLGLILPNLSQPPPNLAQMLRQPPPNLANMCGGPPQMVMGLPPFNQPPPNARPSLLGMPPGGAGNGGGGGVGGGGNMMNNPFNPFASNNHGLNNMVMGGGGGMGGMPFNSGGGLNGPMGPGPVGVGGNNNNNFNKNFNQGGGGGGGNRHFGNNNNNRNQMMRNNRGGNRNNKNNN